MKQYLYLSFPFFYIAALIIETQDYCIRGNSKINLDDIKGAITLPATSI
jgi:hypothetical protein